LKIEGAVFMKRLKINWLLWIQGLLFVAAAVLVFKAVMNMAAIFSAIGMFFSIISPVIVAAAMAYMLSRPCKWIEKWIKKAKYSIIVKYARGLSVLVVYLVVIGICYALLSTLVPLLLSNIMEFVDFTPILFDRVQAFVMNIEWDTLDEVFNITAAIDAFFDDFDIQTIVEPVTQGLGVVTNFAISTAFWVFDFVLALIISIYMLLSKDAIFATVGRIANLVMKTGNMQTLHYYIKQADDLFYKFIGAQFLDACIMGAGSILLLSILNVRFAVFLGILLGVANMIPKFGSIFASIFVIIVTFITGYPHQGVLTTILLTIWQQIDGNVIGPKIMGDALKINPVLVFLSLLIGAQFGIIGMFLSIPAMALVKIIVMNVIEAKETMQHHSDQVASKIEQERSRVQRVKDEGKEKKKYKLKIKPKKPES